MNPGPIDEARLDSILNAVTWIELNQSGMLTEIKTTNNDTTKPAHA